MNSTARCQTPLASNHPGIQQQKLLADISEKLCCFSILIEKHISDSEWNPLMKKKMVKNLVTLPLLR